MQRPLNPGHDAQEAKWREGGTDIKKKKKN